MWQEGVPSIAMVTNIKEDGKIKCQQYWPESGHQKYGPFTVATTENKEYADYVIRVFEVSVSFSAVAYLGGGGGGGSGGLGTPLRLEYEYF